MKQTGDVLLTNQSPSTLLVAVRMNETIKQHLIKKSNLSSAMIRCFVCCKWTTENHCLFTI